MEKINVSSKIKIDSVDEYILVEKIFLRKMDLEMQVKK